MTERVLLGGDYHPSQSGSPSPSPTGTGGSPSSSPSQSGGSPSPSPTGTGSATCKIKYTKTVAAGGTVSFGFQGTWTTNDANPAGFTLSGSSCTAG